jgi:flavin reductase (DIM6/NTAB) family NADH-FMN oxidoreductase RutF
MLHAVDLCGTISGKDGDKFEKAGLTPINGTAVQAPIIAECPVNLECRVRDIIELGIHDMFLGEIVVKHADSAIMKKGKLDLSSIPLIGYINGEYWSMGEKIGRYGCSQKKI